MSSYGEINSGNIENIATGFSKAYMYPWNSSGTAVAGAPGMIVKSGDVNGIVIAVSSNGDLFFGQKQNQNSSWKWFKLTGTAL